MESWARWDGKPGHGAESVRHAEMSLAGNWESISQVSRWFLDPGERMGSLSAMGCKFLVLIIHTHAHARTRTHTHTHAHTRPARHLSLYYVWPIETGRLGQPAGQLTTRGDGRGDWAGRLGGFCGGLSQTSGARSAEE